MYDEETIILEDCPRLSIKGLKDAGYLRPYERTNAPQSWSCYTPLKGNYVDLIVVMGKNSGYMYLKYWIKGQEVSSKVEIVSRASNLGKGHIYGFKCPETGLVCCHLYLTSNHFLHRTAIKGCMYRTQTYSHDMRQIKKLMDVCLWGDELYEPRKRYSKGHYRGKHTKTMIRADKKEEAIYGLLKDKAYNEFLDRLEVTEKIIYRVVKR